MKFRHALSFLIVALALAACASQPAAYRADVYRDGSYYSPGGGDGAGDYYYAPEPRDDYYLRPAFYYGYGWPVQSFTGYCSARYRYCPSAFGFGYPFDHGWYDPFRDPYYYYRPDRRGRGHHHRPPPDPSQRPPNSGEPVFDNLSPPGVTTQDRPSGTRERVLTRRREARDADPPRRRVEEREGQ